MGRITVDQRLSDVLNFLCEQEKINPTTLEGEGKRSFLLGNREDIKSLRATIDYLKDYAKLQTLAKALSNSEGLAQDIEKAKIDFAKLIEERKTQIQTMPKPKKRNSGSYIYDYEDKFKEAESRRIEIETEERAHKIASLKEDIRIYQGKIKKLDQIKKSLGNPQKVMEILLPEEYTNVKDNYARLINLCATSMLEGFNKDELVGEGKPFNYEDGKYTVNYNGARKFLSTLKAKKQVMAATDFIDKKEQYAELTGERRKTLEEVNSLKAALQASNTEEFEYMVARMNNISHQYLRLEEMEEKASRGTIFSRMRDGIREALGLRRLGAKVPRKVWDARYDLAEDIEALTEEVKENPELEAAFNAYQLATDSREGIQEFSWKIDQLKRYGVQRVYFHIEQLTVSEHKENLQHELSYKQRELNVQRQESDEAKHIALDTYAGLTKKTKSILGKQDKETIVRIAKEYYGQGKEDTRFNIRRPGQIAPSTAAIILESIIGRKNITWEQIATSYATILGKENMNIEELDLERAVDKKVDVLRDYFSKSAQRESSNEREIG